MSVPGVDVYLVSCVSQKRRTRSQARDLYLSPWFRKARAFVEASGMPWFILSAEYGLLDPEVQVEPYERTLNEMPISDRRAWAERVVKALTPHCVGVRRIVVLAGTRYRDLLMPMLRALCHNVVVPMEGMRIGEQLRWLGTAIRSRP